MLKPHSADEIPSREALANIVDTAFWASLGKEEARPVRFKIAYEANRETLLGDVAFVRPIDYSVGSIVKLAHSCGEYGHLLVSTSADGLEIFGRAEDSGSFFAVKAIDPGQLVLRAGVWNVAAISGAEIAFIRDPLLGVYGEMWNRLGKWQGDDTDPEVDTRRSVLVNVARKMRHLERGGAVIVIPSDDGWRCCVSEMNESRSLGTLRYWLDVQADAVKTSGKKPFLYESYVGIGVDDLAVLTQIDGAVLIRPDLSLVGFGVDLKPADQSADALVYEVDPLDHDDGQLFRPTQSIGGMRHRSAARFVQDNPESLAIVKSEDGIVSCFVSQAVNGQQRVVRYKRLELTLF